MEKTRKLYIDCPSWTSGISVDDFLVVIGKKQSNSVYHVAKVKSKPSPKKRMTRYNVEVYKSDLITSLKRDNDQKLFEVTWYSSNKKKK